MSLRKQTFLIIIGTTLGLVIILCVCLQLILGNSFSMIERNYVYVNARRAGSAVMDTCANLDMTVNDWASWDDTYAFVEDGNDKYIKSNLIDGTLIDLQINVILFIDPSGRIVYAKGFDQQQKKETPIPPDLKSHLTPTSPLVYHSDTDYGVAGILLLPEGPLLIASRPILTSEDEGPIRGALIMGRFLDETEIERLEQITHLSLQFQSLDAPDLSPDFKHAASTLSETKPVDAHPLSIDTIAGYILLNDVYDNPVLIGRVEIPRDIYRQGRLSVLYFATALIVVCLVFVYVAMALLKKQVLDRLVKLNVAVTDIGTTRDLSRRIPSSGEDEISALTEAINTTLASLERAEQDKANLQEQLLHSQKMEAVGQLTAGIAHDFNNLLTAITGFAELMLQHLKPVDPMHDFATRILHSGKRAAQLVSQLMVFSRRQITELSPLDLNNLITNMRDMMQRIIGEHITLDTYLSSDLWLVEADATQIEQVIVNLAVNARDAMPDGGSLKITTQNFIRGEVDPPYAVTLPDEEYVRLKISDSGIGMSEYVKAHIFEPFFTTKERGKGTGLGLSTVYGIIQQHEGQVFVHSEEGEGTTFDIYLSRVKDAQKVTRSLEITDSFLRGSERLLLVEDNKEVRQLAGDILNWLGYDVLVAKDAQQALQILDNCDPLPDLLVTDIVMPGVSGKDLAKQVRLMFSDIKTLFISGYTDEAIDRYDVLHGDIALLRKPFTAVELSYKVRAVLDQA